MSPRPSARATPVQSAATEALRFGGIVLPNTAEVLGVESSKGIDQLYRIAVRVEPGTVEPLLTASKFTTPLEKGRRVFMPPVRGFNPDNGSDIASAQDTLPPEGGRRKTVAREILVDRSDPEHPVVHLWLFTT